MGHVSSGPGVKPGVLAAGRDGSNALSFANNMYRTEASVTDIAESQPAGLVYSFIPKHLHPLEIVHVIACTLAANISAAAIKKRYRLVLPTAGSRFDCAAAMLH